MATKNEPFRHMINSTALDSITDKFHVKLDRANLKTPKINYKGVAQPAVIRKATGKEAKEGSVDPIQAGAYPPNWTLPGEKPNGKSPWEKKLIWILGLKS
jgi:hypothetical protein